MATYTIGPPGAPKAVLTDDGQLVRVLDVEGNPVAMEEVSAASQASAPAREAVTPEDGDPWRVNPETGRFVAFERLEGEGRIQRAAPAPRAPALSSDTVKIGLVLAGLLAVAAVLK